MTLVRWIGPLLLGIISTASQAQRKPHQTQQQVSQRQVIRTAQLSELGFSQGVTLQGISAERTLYFPIPPDAIPTTATLTFPYTFALDTIKTASLEILVNGDPRDVVRLGANTRTGIISVPLEVRDLSARFIQVTLQLRRTLTDNICTDERMATGFVRFAPEGGLQLAYAPEAIQTVAAAWGALPSRTTIALPQGGVTPAQFQTAWQLAAALQRSGRQVTFSTLPAEGDVVVAYPPQLGADYVPVGDSTAAAVEANVRVYRRGGTPVLVVSDARAIAATGFLRDAWSPIGLGPALDVRVSGQPSDTDDHIVTFAQLGSLDESREIVERGEWTKIVELRDLPPGTVPRAITVDLVAAPTAGTAGPSGLAYVSLNGTLLSIFRLKQDGRVQRLTTEIPTHVLSVDNTFSITVQRESRGGGCERYPEAFTTQLLRTSFLTVTQAPSSATMFYSLPPLFKRGFTTYVPQGALTQPEHILPMLVSLGATYLPMGQLIAVRTLPTPFSPTTPFVVVGHPTDVTAPVRFDQGRIVLMGPHNTPELDVSGAQGMTVAQLAKAGNMEGLWLASVTGDALAAPPATAVLDRGTVAFMTDRGIAYTLDTRHDQMYTVTYPEISRWDTTYGRYRFWILGLGWLLITLGFIWLVRQLFRIRTHS